MIINYEAKDRKRMVNNPVTVKVYDGVAGAFASSLTLSFADTNTKVAAAQSGTEVEKTGNLTVTLSAFQHAGIYRYKITEVANPTDVISVGLDARDSAYDSTRYLDVYIKNGSNGLEMYGAVIFKSTDANAISDTNGDIKENGKLEGFFSATVRRHWTLLCRCRSGPSWKSRWVCV